MRVVSETKNKVTKSVIEAAWKRRAPGQRLIVRDGECRGLCLIVNPRTMVWSFAYRPPGKDPRTGRRWLNRPMVLGSPDVLTRDEAKQTVERLKVGRLDGRDPAAARKAAKEAATRKQAHTLERLLADYEIALPQRPKMRGTAGKPGKAYVAGELRQVHLAIETIGQATPASDVTEAEIRKLLRGPSARNRFGALSRFFDWLVEEAIVAQNPCVQVPKSKRPRPYGTRSRHLQPAALAILWQAAAGLREPVWRDLVRFLIAIPCRRGEAARLDWSHLDLSGCVWSQPAALTKNGDPHRLRLHPLALAVLESRRQAWAEAEAPGDVARQAALLANGYPRLGRRKRGVELVLPGVGREFRPTRAGAGGGMVEGGAAATLHQVAEHPEPGGGRGRAGCARVHDRRYREAEFSPAGRPVQERGGCGLRAGVGADRTDVCAAWGEGFDDGAGRVGRSVLLLHDAGAGRGVFRHPWPEYCCGS
jgi:integrase